MSLFQCEACGCVENTALCNYHWRKLKQMPLVCSACDTDKDIGGEGKWHGDWERVYLPKGMFVTNREGNLAHKENGDTDFRKYAIQPLEDR